MKYLLFFFLTASLLGKPIFLDIDTKFHLPAEFKTVIETNLEEQGFKLISLKQDAFSQEATEPVKLNCKKEACYKEIAKKLNADYLMRIKVRKKNSVYTFKYAFRAELIDLKTFQVIKKLLYYKGKLHNINNLEVFAEEFMLKFFTAIEKEKERKKEEELSKIPLTLTKKDVLDMIRSVYPEVKNCGRQHKKTGLVKVRFKINQTGRISNLFFIKDDQPELNTCLKKVLNTMQTKKFRGDAIDINFPLKLD